MFLPQLVVDLDDEILEVGQVGNRGFEGPRRIAREKPQQLVAGERAACTHAQDGLRQRSACRNLRWGGDTDLKRCEGLVPLPLKRAEEESAVLYDRPFDGRPKLVVRDGGPLLLARDRSEERRVGKECRL